MFVLDCTTSAGIIIRSSHFSRRPSAVDRPDDSHTSAWLIARLRDPQDNPAWNVFWQRYQPRIRGWAISCGLSNDEVEEITSQVLAKLVEKMPEFDYDARQSFRGWLRMVVQNVVRDF